MNSRMCSYWLEQIKADLPRQDQWLSAKERSYLASLRFEKRRSEWRLGRWTAKLAVMLCLNLPQDTYSLQDVEIRPSASGAPAVFFCNGGVDVSISLSHRAGYALCVLGPFGAELGCDLELVEPRTSSFTAEFLSVSEQKLLGEAAQAERSFLTTLLWSAKESALKALKIGLRMSTASLDVSFTPRDLGLGQLLCGNSRADWFPLSIGFQDGKSVHGWWRYGNGLIRTVVFNPSQNGVRS